jgi:hypothetical protein
VAPGIAGILAHISIEATPSYGYNNGTDLVLFESLDDLRNPHAVRVSRNEFTIDAAGGAGTLLLKSPAVGGFVPMKARMSDGSFHKHGGSGFALGPSHRFPATGGGGFSWRDPHRYDMLEVFQLRYDSSGLTSVCEGTWTQNMDAPLRIADTEWCIFSHGLTSAIADGSDLLFTVMARKSDRAAAGVSRWSHRDGHWRPVSFQPVTENEAIPPDPKRVHESNIHERTRWLEPSLVRARDGSLLFCARGSDTYCSTDGTESCFLVQVWRSIDGGRSWSIFLRVPEVRNVSPVTVNRSVDGTAYLASNPFRPAFTIGPRVGRGREDLSLWPINEERSVLDAPLSVVQALSEFGEAPPSPDPEWYDCWLVDHPNSATIQLGDGFWHDLLAYRVTHSPLFGSLSIAPASQVGCHISEVLSYGPVQPLWEF